MRDAIVIIPTYNEIENIEAIIKAVFSKDKKYYEKAVSLISICSTS